MLSDPQSINPGGGAVSLARIEVGNMLARYANSDNTLELDVKHQITKVGRVRSEVSLVQTKVVTDPVSSTNDSEDCTVRILIDRPPFGWTQAQIISLVAGLKTWLTETADTGNIAKLYGKES